MSDNVMNEVLNIAKEADMEIEDIVIIKQDKKSLECDLTIIYSMLHSLEQITNLLYELKLDKVLSPYAANICGDAFEKRTYLGEVDHVDQWIKGKRDKIRRSLEKLGDE